MRTGVIQNGFCIVSPYISKPMMFCTQTCKDRDSWVKVSEQIGSRERKYMYISCVWKMSMHSSHIPHTGPIAGTEKLNHEGGGQEAII